MQKCHVTPETGRSIEVTGFVRLMTNLHAFVVNVIVVSYATYDLSELLMNHRHSQYFLNIFLSA